MKLTVSNSLIIIRTIFTLFSFQNKEILVFGMNNNFLVNKDYLMVFFQFCLYSFLHGGIMHLIFNSLFLYIFGNQVEQIIGIKKYIYFFIFLTILNGISILILTNSNTIGISGFAMGILTFYTLKLYEIKNSDYKGGITAIIINILIGFSPSISLVGHLFGALFGGIYYFLIKENKRF